VPNQSPETVLSLLNTHLESINFKGRLSVLGMEHPVRTSPLSLVVKAMIESAKSVYKVEPSVIPNSVGTQPMELFVKGLGIKECVSAIGAGDTSSNAHAPNENVSIENFYKAILHSAEFFRIYSKL
jgi:acetylornithine deacetylase/succinyl-diaminopimelate desuccinylase-like protein